MSDPRDSDATRLALAMVRADWQDDEDSWNQLWALTEDPGELARELTRLCREQLDRLAAGRRCLDRGDAAPDGGDAHPAPRAGARQPGRPGAQAAQRFLTLVVRRGAGRVSPAA